MKTRKMRARLLQGDCLKLLPRLDENSIDAIVTDPPYGLGFMGKEWDSPGGRGDFPMRRTDAINTVNTGVSRQGGRQRSCRDFARRQAREAREFQEWSRAWAEEALRVLKPGGHLLAFGGTRMFHRLACALEDAGFEIRDCVLWLYGSGFPKSLDVGKAIDKAAGKNRKRIRGVRSSVVGSTFAQDEWSKQFKDSVLDGQPITRDAKRWDGWGTALKPGWEPIILARKPPIGNVAQNVLRFGTGGINVDNCRVAPTGEHLSGGNTSSGGRREAGDGWQRPWMQDAAYLAKRKTDCIRRQSKARSRGRWPANVAHDGTEDVLNGFPRSKAATNRKPVENADGDGDRISGGKGFGRMTRDVAYRDDGSAGRFFYCAKASRADRNAGLHDPGPQFKHGATLRKVENADKRGNTHPTVKPTDLMRWLCRLITPPDGLILDPFAGSCSTGKAAILEGFRFLGLEREPEYLAIGRARLKAARRAA